MSNFDSIPSAAKRNEIRAEMEKKELPWRQLKQELHALHLLLEEWSSLFSDAEINVVKDHRDFHESSALISLGSETDHFYLSVKLTETHGLLYSLMHGNLSQQWATSWSHEFHACDTIRSSIFPLLPKR
jgi:hypothetical protein